MSKNAVTRLLSCVLVTTWSVTGLSIPQITERDINSRDYTATFENTSGGQISPSAPLPGPYDALYYGHFAIGPFDYESGFCAGVCPASFPEEAVFGGSYSPQPGSISVFYPESNVTYFQLNSFFFGCSNGSDVDVSNCVITAKGYKNTNRRFPEANRKPDYEASFRYNPQYERNPETEAPYAEMRQAVVKGWTKLKTVTFNAILDPPSSAKPLIFMDNINYVATNVTK